MAPTQQEIMRGPNHWDPIERIYVSDGAIPPPLEAAKLKPEDIVKGTHYWDSEKRQYVAGERPSRLPKVRAESEAPQTLPRVKQHIEPEVLDEMTPAQREKLTRRKRAS